MRRLRSFIWLSALLLLAGCAAGEPTAAPAPAEETAAADYGGQLRISELMVKNRASVLAPEFPGWAELENCSGGTLDYGGWSLTDRPDREGLTLSGTPLRPGDLLLLPLGEGFSLSEGETLYLRAPDGSVQDSVFCAACAADCSLARQEDGSFAGTAWISPGYENTAEGYERFAASRTPEGPLQIWEAMVSNREHPLPDGALCDWVELRNCGGEPLALSGYTLSDDAARPDRWRLPARTLAPGELLLVACDDARPADKENTGFALDAVRERLYLYDGQGRLADYAVLHDIPVEGSMGRVPGEAGFFYFVEPSPGAENAEGFRRVSAMPEALTADGVHEGVGSLRVSLSAPGRIYYTTDGSAPDTDSALYEGPIVLDRTTVIRAAALEEGAALSRTASFSYILNEGHTLPVLSLCADEPERFQRAYGAGNKAVTVSANLSLYEDGGRVFSQDCELGLRGWTSLILPKKSLGVEFSGRFGGPLRCELFDDGIDLYRSLSIRAGQDYGSAFIRNELFQDLAREGSEALLTQAGRYCVLYLNGRYWGVYCLKEDVSRQFYASHMGVSRESVEGNRMPAELHSPFYAVVEMGMYTDLSREENYRRFCELVELDSLIDWFLFEGYCGNTDTQGNLRLYRSTENGNRWSFVFYDLDWSFDWIGACFTGFVNEINHAGGDLPPMIRNLSRNGDFRLRCLTRWAELIGGVLSNEHVLEKIDAYEALLAPEMGRERARWQLSEEAWYAQMDRLRWYITDVAGQDWASYTTAQLCRALGSSAGEELAAFGHTITH